MPLIIITGHACSGKTYRANQILTDFQTRISNQHPSEPKRAVTLIPSNHASLDPVTSSQQQPSNDLEQQNPAIADDLRDQIYNSASLEKTARASEISAIKRALSKNNVVIADGLNYIKGFRYQLWCEAKAAGTRCCVVHVAAREDECVGWNEDRLKNWGRGDEVIQKKQQSSGTGNGVGLVGRDVLGDLIPESHTNIYGDRAVVSDDFDRQFDEEDGRRSRGSSTGAAMSEEEGEEDDENTDLPPRAGGPEKDTMTLKSLYIHSDEPERSAINTRTHLPATNQDDSLPLSPLSTLDSSSPPALGFHFGSNYPPSIQQTLSQQHNTPPLPPPSNSSYPYSPSTLQSLHMRYEPPSPFSRWDTPLFTIPTTDAHPPYTSIWESLFPPPTTKPLTKKALSQLPSKSSSANEDNNSQEERSNEVKPHAATVLPQATSAEALQILESGTADVVKSLLSAYRASSPAEEGGELAFSVPGSGSTGTRDIEVSLRIPLNTTLSQPILQRLRRKYTQIQRGGIAHGKGYVSGREDVVRGFVDFLEAEFGSDE